MIIKENISKIEIRRNHFFPGIESKSGKNQFSRHSHVHQDWSLSIVLHGKTTVALGPWKSLLKENQFIAIPPGYPHLCSPHEAGTFEFLVLYIPPEYIDSTKSLFSVPRTGYMDSSLPFCNLESLILNASYQKELNTAIDKLENFMGENSHIIKHDYGENIFSEIEEVPVPDPDSSRYQQYRLYRKRFGIGQRKLCTIEKMEKAKALLSEGGDLCQIALECGYYDQSHFSKVFKLYTGMTPGKYLCK